MSSLYTKVISPSRQWTKKKNKWKNKKEKPNENNSSCENTMRVIRFVWRCRGNCNTQQNNNIIWNLDKYIHLALRWFVQHELKWHCFNVEFYANCVRQKNLFQWFDWNWTNNWTFRFCEKICQFAFIIKSVSCHRTEFQIWNRIHFHLIIKIMHNGKFYSSKCSMSGLLSFSS